MSYRQKVSNLLFKGAMPGLSPENKKDRLTQCAKRFLIYMCIVTNISVIVNSYNTICGVYLIVSSMVSI